MDLIIILLVLLNLIISYTQNNKILIDHPYIDKVKIHHKLPLELCLMQLFITQYTIKIVRFLIIKIRLEDLV